MLEKIRDIEKYVLTSFYFVGKTNLGENLEKANEKVKIILRMAFNYETLQLAQKIRIETVNNLNKPRAVQGDRFREFCRQEKVEDAMEYYAKAFGSVTDKFSAQMRKKKGIN